jgi:sarcosine oxidase subunit alpha
MSVGWAAAANLLSAGWRRDQLLDRLAAVCSGEVCRRACSLRPFERRVRFRGAGGGRHARRHVGGGACGARRREYGGAVGRAQRRPSHAFPIIDHPKGKNFVDFDEDLQVKDLENAAQEGFDSSELMKRYSTVGMGPSQGKHSNMNALRVLARYRGIGVEHAGTHHLTAHVSPGAAETPGRPQLLCGTSFAAGCGA